MTPTRRTRKSALSNTSNTTSKPTANPSSTNKKQKSTNNNSKSNQQLYTSEEEEEDEEEESSDAGSVTRCICGEAHNLGLMVQCDKCEVWQHCECIGLIQDKLPDQYYCDQCHPENHQIVKTSSGRSKRLYLVDNKNNQNESPASCSPQMNSDKRPSKRRKKTDSPVNERASPINKTASPQVEPLSVDEVVTTTAATTTTTTTPGSTRSTRRNTNKEDLVLFEDVINKKPTKAHTPTISAAAASVTKKEDSPTTNHNEPFWNFSNGKPTRASSPPAKVKYPNTKMTFSDMNKRAKQIMDCISKWQPTTSSPAQLSHASLLLFESQYSRPRSLSTSSSSSSSCLSTASTVPLLLDDYTTTEGSSPSTPIPYLQQQQQTQKQPHQETSLDILERINHELTKFQRKFGTMYQEPKVNKSTAAA